MLPFFDYFRQLNIAGVALRLLLATILGGYIGYERGRKHRAAGLRTYMIVCIGAALTLLIGQYQFTMYRGAWQTLISHIDSDPDVARYGAQVVNGIGFLGAGTIILTGRREVKGLTTAAGLWASACMGLAIGAGFYEGVFLCVILIAVSMRALSWLETKIVERTRNVNLFVEFGSMKQLGEIIASLKTLNVRILHIDIDTDSDKKAPSQNAVFYVRILQPMPHEELLSTVAALDCVQTIYEL
ncbi:MAG: MgtC/SapB family protein [Lachnospiraceae bacterium]|nr:MgtC/SapB family protein [Lachnospiraceae bacterium]